MRDSEFRETCDLLKALQNASGEAKEAIRRYLCKHCLGVVVANGKGLLAGSSPFLKNVLECCLRAGDDFARLLGFEQNRHEAPLVRRFIWRLIHLIELNSQDFGREALQLLGMLAKHGISGSVEALRRCLENSKPETRIHAARLLEDWESKEQLTHPYRIGANGAVVFPPGRAQGYEVVPPGQTKRRPRPPTRYCADFRRCSPSGS
jgi:hypothetical protein